MYKTSAGCLLCILFSGVIFREVRPATTYLSEKINPKVNQRITRLRNLVTDLPRNTIVIVDGDNVRGKTKFSATKEQLCEDLDLLVHSCGISDRVVLMYDHGNEHEAFLYSSLAVCFSGPGKSADDIIARDVVWFQRRFQCPVVVVTADSGLKTRCSQGGRITGQQVSFVDSTLFVELLGATLEAIPLNERKSNTSALSPTLIVSEPTNELSPSESIPASTIMTATPHKMNLLRRELGMRNQIRSIEKYSKGGCGKKKMVKMQKRAAELNKKLIEVVSREYDSLDTTISNAMKMSPEYQEAGYNALVGMLRAGSTRGREETWERVLLAERFRKRLLANQIESEITSVAAMDTIATEVVIVSENIQNGVADASSDITEILPLLPSGALNTYVSEINKNFSKTNTSAVLRTSVAVESVNVLNEIVETVINTSLTAPLTSLRGEASTVHSGIDSSASTMSSLFLIIDVPGPKIPDEEGKSQTIWSPIVEQILMQQLRQKEEAQFEEDRRMEMTEEERLKPTRSSKALLMMAKSLRGPRMTNNVPFQVNAEGSRIYDIETLCRTKSQKKIRGDSEASVSKKESEDDGISDVSVAATSLRIVCISDTHGMESVLSGSVPDGDILIHAGDFAADKGKSRLKLKQLDEWMAALPHELKIVVRGNHDPSGGCFPLSKAIYAERATTVMFRGVAIGLVPHGAISVPNASIVVSHEPPYGVLDQAIGRKKPHVGSHYLQKSAMKMTVKPQLWIFGHIHEGFGAIRTTFGARGLTTHPENAPVYSSTLCVNAASANPGPAHSIDNLPICIDVKNVLNVTDTLSDDSPVVK